MYTARILPPVKYRFGNGVGHDKFRGLQTFGPYKKPSFDSEPIFGFVFPSEYRDIANKLYAALKNGAGYFKGIPSAFQLSLSKNQVFQISDFSLTKGQTLRDEARQYADAITSWASTNDNVPDLFFVIHPRTSDWLDQTPYYECKALLLKEGFLSQHVTVDLIETSSQFEWSVANIALQAFAKLGGTPWIADDIGGENQLLLGVGTSSLYDPTDRQLRRYIGYTSCYTGSGEFRFVSLANVAKTRDEHLKKLSDVVRNSLERACADEPIPNEVTLHIPKQAGKDERRAINIGVEKATGIPGDIQVQIVRVNDAHNILAVDPDSSDGVPNRGTVLKVGDNDFMVFTEGREERQVWRQRTPTCVRVIPQNQSVTTSDVDELIRQVYRISQINWRAFNAGSRPITTYYGNLIATVLSHIPGSIVEDFYQDKAINILENRPWFL